MSVPYVEIKSKKEDKIFEMPARDFLNPKASVTSDTEFLKELKPKGFNSAFTITHDLMDGEIYQTIDWMVRLKGAHHKWEW